jgi:hypothetical protein
LRILLALLLASTLNASSTLAAPSRTAGLELEISIVAPEKSVPLGEPFRYRVLIVNRGDDRVRLLPIFFHSRDYLEVTAVDCGVQAEPAAFTVDFESGLDRGDFVILGSGSFVGQEFLVTPEQPLEYIYGLSEGTCRLRAQIQLHSYPQRFSWNMLPPVDTNLESDGTEVTFGPPLEETVARRRKQLHSSDLMKVSEALAYFSSVRSPGVEAELMNILGKPQGWTARFHDPVVAIWALRRNAGEAALEYFKDALSSRHHQVALEAIEQVGHEDSSDGLD